MLLCSTDGGQVFAMTENHHPDARVEAIRLRRMMGASNIMDSFGESRYVRILGIKMWCSFQVDGWVHLPIQGREYAIATPALMLKFQLCRLGDLQYKRFGVTPEPEVRTKLLEGEYTLRDILLLTNSNSRFRNGLGVHCSGVRRHLICGY